MEVGCRIELLGGLRARLGGQFIKRFRTQRTGALLAYLAYFRDRSHAREVLLDLFWPEDDFDVARHKLSVALSSLRKQLEPPGVPDGAILTTGRHSVGLDPATLTTDVAEFEAAIRTAAESRDEHDRMLWLAEAVELYRGELLPGYYEEWIPAEQHRLSDLFLAALRQLSRHLAESGEMEGALRYARRAADVDPLHEEACRDLMRLLAAAGEPAAALRQYRHLEQALTAEVGAVPSTATQALAREIEGGPIETRREQSGNGLPAGPHVNIPVSGAAPEPTPSGQRLSAPVSVASLEPVGGAVPLESRFYILRPTDEEFRAAIARQDSIVLVKGARQVGKSSLLARGMQQARDACPVPARVALTDFETLNAMHFATAESLLRALAESIADQLDLEVPFDDVWQPHRGPNPNFARYLRREVLPSLSAPLFWALDGVDRLFTWDCGSEVLALFRSWHNERVLDPEGPWSRLTLAIAYATEAHLFIADLNQSPFNVGTRLTLDDFTAAQVADLNVRYGSPLRSDSEVARFYRLVGGHPYLARRGLHEMAVHSVSLPALAARAGGREGVFADHLRRMFSVLARDEALCEVMKGVLRGQPCPTEESFYRLRSAGIVSGESERDARPRCQLYTAYLERRLL